MQISVSLGGYISPWNFSGSGALDSWVADRAWLKSGGLCVIHTDGASVTDDLYVSISQSIRAAHDDEGSLTVRRIFCNRTIGPLQAILSEFEISLNLSPFEAKAPLLSSLRDRKAVFLMEETEELDGEVWDAFVSTLEYFSKMSPPVQLCAVIFDSRKVVYCQPSCDFSKGRPTHAVLTSEAIQTVGQLWPAYLHHRIAWEAGGNLSYAKHLSESCSHIAQGDDDLLESALTKVSAEVGDQQGIKAALVGYLNSLEVSRTGAVSISSSLLEKGLLWRPLGGQSLRIVPWASRYLLSSLASKPKWVWSLRNNLVCGPLASEILVICLHAESQIRTDLHGHEDIDNCADAERNQSRFLNGKDDYVQYPKAHPAPPIHKEDVWAFASLGETLNACPAQPKNYANWAVLHLRNCVSHGHYVNWAHVQHASNALRSFCF